MAVFALSKFAHCADNRFVLSYDRPSGMVKSCLMSDLYTSAFTGGQLKTMKAPVNNPDEHKESEPIDMSAIEIEHAQLTSGMRRYMVKLPRALFATPFYHASACCDANYHSRSNGHSPDCANYQKWIDERQEYQRDVNTAIQELEKRETVKREQDCCARGTNDLVVTVYVLANRWDGQRLRASFVGINCL